MDYKELLIKGLKDSMLAGVGALSLAAETVDKFSHELVKKGSETIKRDKIFSSELNQDLENFFDISNSDPNKNFTEAEIDLIIEKLTPEQKSVLIEKILKNESSDGT